ncbi:MAG: EFR1 family ferrodoxin [Veillonellales bacterium]
MAYYNAILYYFTGTGNSYRVACWLGEELANQGSAAQLLPIDRRENICWDGDLLGLVFPTHGFTAPWQVIRFVLGLPRSKKGHAFVAVTRAGTRLWERNLPGMEGSAGYLIALLLFYKGYSVRGVTGLDMPSNWLTFHSGINPVNAAAIIDRTRPKTRNFALRITAGKRYYNGRLPLFLGLILWKISLAYLVLGRFFLAKLAFASAQCDGCGVCAAGCPANAIKLRGRTRLRPYWTFACESCMRCMAYCPKQAVQSSHSLFFILYMLTTVPAAAYLLQLAADKMVWLPSWMEELLQYGYILLSIYLVYQIFNAMLYVPLLNKMFAYTTLTRIYRRYHAPGVGLGQIVKPRILAGRLQNKNKLTENESKHSLK